MIDAGEYPPFPELVTNPIFIDSEVYEDGTYQFKTRD